MNKTVPTTAEYHAGQMNCTNCGKENGLGRHNADWGCLCGFAFIYDRDKPTADETDEEYQERMKEPCKYCKDENGESIYPYYGVAPHKSFNNDGQLITSEQKPTEQWPANFIEDEDEKGCGIYTHCLTCGSTSV